MFLFLRIIFVFIVPTGAPLNCTNTNIQSISVDLNWAPPEISLQNGQLISYNINCSQIGQHYTNNVSRLTLSVTGLSPYTSYSCDVSAVNVVGEGPATTCSFTTAQDSKLIHIFKNPIPPFFFPKYRLILLKISLQLPIKHLYLFYG